MRQAEKEKKKFYSRIPFKLDPGKKIQKKNGKKIEKLKKTSFRHYFLPKRDEIGREREKKFYSRIPLMLDPGKKIQKKNGKKIEKIKKTSFRHYFLPKRDEIGRGREKKKFTSEFRSYSTEARKFPKKQQKN